MSQYGQLERTCLHFEMSVYAELEASSYSCGKFLIVGNVSGLEVTSVVPL